MGELLELLLPLPDSIKEMLAQAAPKKDPQRDKPVCELDDPQSVAKAIKYLQESAPIEWPAIQVAYQVRDMGISQRVCLDLMWDFYAGRCTDPWDWDVLAQKVENAYRYPQNRAGVKSPVLVREAFEPIEIGDYTTDERPKPFFEYELTGDPPMREWVVRDWLPVGEVSSLYGDGGQGKTLLAEQLGFCVSRGLRFFGMETAHMPVFAALAEDDKDEVHRRIEAFRKHYQTSVDPKAYFQIFAFPSEDYTLAKTDGDGKLGKGPFYDRLTEFISEMPAGKKLLILDTLADLFDGNENIRNQANKFVKNVLRGLCVKHHTTILFLAHPSRAGMSSDNSSGSTAWNGAVRNRLSLSSHQSIPDLRLLTRIKSNYARQGEQIALRWQNGVFVVTDENAALCAVSTSYEDCILGLISEKASDGNAVGDTRNHANSIFNYLNSIKDIAGESIKGTTLKEILKKLITEGKIERLSGDKKGRNGLYPRGFWRLIESDEF